MHVNDIQSIGWLNAADGTINLTPCLKGSAHPTLVKITKAEFDSLGECEDRMKQKAVDLLLGEQTQKERIEAELKHYRDNYQVIGVSVAHLSPEAIVALDGLAFDRQCNMVMKRDTGWFLKIYESEEYNKRDMMPETLNNLVQHCFEAGYRMVEFDTDAAIYSYLPVFEQS